MPIPNGKPVVVSADALSIGKMREIIERCIPEWEKNPARAEHAKDMRVALKEFERIGYKIGPTATVGQAKARLREEGLCSLSYLLAGLLGLASTAATAIAAAIGGPVVAGVVGGAGGVLLLFTCVGACKHFSRSMTGSTVLDRLTTPLTGQKMLE